MDFSERLKQAERLCEEKSAKKSEPLSQIRSLKDERSALTNKIELENKKATVEIIKKTRLTKIVFECILVIVYIISSLLVKASFPWGAPLRFPIWNEVCGVLQYVLVWIVHAIVVGVGIFIIERSDEL